MEVVSNELKPNSTQVYLMARALNEDIKEFFSVPANEKAFKEWKSKKEVKASETKATSNRKG